MKRKRIIKPIARLARIIVVVALQFLLLTTSAIYVSAQELNPSVISSGGETFTASGISLDFVIGEIATESYTEQGVLLTQGFLQGIEETSTINVRSINVDDIDVYPNPSSDLVHIVYSGKDTPLSIEILNTQGCLINSIQFTDSFVEANVEQFPSGLYIIKIIFSNHNFVTKRIIKK